MVGAVGFELTTLCSQSRCATRLRYAPTKPLLYIEPEALAAKNDYFDNFLSDGQWALQQPCFLN